VAQPLHHRRDARVALVPLTVAGVALAGPVVTPDLSYRPDDGPQRSHYFNAGTASGLARPPGGYWHEQPLPKVAYRMVSPKERAA
jgi:hypothetical protein